MLLRALLFLVLTNCVLLNGQPHLVTEFQNNEDVVLKQLFQSVDPAEQAWAAYLAGGHKLTKWIPEIRELLGSADSGVVSAALDALIQLNADVSYDELMRKVPRYHVHIIILLAKRPKENRDALFSLLKQSLTDEEWTALNNLLVSIKDTDIAFELVRALETKITVSVFDALTTSVAGVPGGNPGGLSGTWYVRSDLPPIFVYRLSDRPANGDVLVARGLHPIYYQRFQGDSLYSHKIDRNAYRYDFLAELLGTRSEVLPIKSTEQQSLRWTTAERYSASISKIRASAQLRFRQLLGRLQQDHLLTASQALDLKLQLIIEPLDHRKNRQSPLPKVISQ